ncbi:mechanosensitive ion channel family protein [Lutimaribacter sp. EGI FJ00015]|nr:mechanosensitive ion channel family protein [Lutimaribacter sp. EGI FJ00015]MCO0637585.1 mechanosensitive ion channel family protein [Lutimaribacter sp. EGI FJ00014]
MVAMLAITAPLAAQDNPELWYETEAINPGLDAPPSEMDRSSPRVALRSFLELAETGDFETAMHFLNLSKLPEEEQKSRGHDLAAKLASTIDRKLLIDWADIPPEADARSPDSTTDQQHSEPRRDFLLEELEVAGDTYAIRLGRYAEKTPEGEAHVPVWLISTDTVANIDMLHDAFGPTALESHIPRSLKGEFGGLQLWEWIALPLLISVVILVGFLTSWLVGLGRYMSSDRIQHRVFERAALPLSLVTASVTAKWLLGFAVSFSGQATMIIGLALVMLAVVGFCLAALRSIDALLDHLTRRHLGNAYDTPSSSEREFYTSMYALRRVVLVATVGFSIVFVLMQFNLFADIGVTLLASAGVLTVILGIAGQATLGNMVASLQIAIAKPVRIGDSIHYEGDWCIVEAIFFTFIRLRTWDERRIIVPVKYFLSYPFRNWSVINERMICTIQMVLDPMADVDVLRKKFVALGKADPEVIEHDQLFAYLTGHSSNGLTIEFYAMAPNPWKAWTIEMRLREELVNFVRREHPEWWWRERINL